MIDWLKYKKITLALSFVMIVVSTISLTLWGLRLGVDFRGGTIIEYAFSREVSTEDLTKVITETGLDVASIQKTSDNTYLLRFPPFSGEEKETVRGAVESYAGELEERRFETVGPSIGPELIKKTVYAIAFATGAILLWIAYQFKSIKYGTSAILAMLHDTFILVGVYSLLGHLMQVEIDFLFVTALLTILSFSVHDTIVVYDRVRETQKKEGGDISILANRAITETMVRSLNNSFTIIFMLVALVLLGGTTVQWFALALLVGTVLGTYSSPFVAVPFLVMWSQFENKKNK